MPFTVPYESPAMLERMFCPFAGVSLQVHPIEIVWPWVMEAEETVREANALEFTVTLVAADAVPPAPVQVTL